MSTTIPTRWIQGKKSHKDASATRKINTRSQQLDSVKKLNDILQEMTYGSTKEAIEKKLAAANKYWMKKFFKKNKKL